MTKAQRDFANYYIEQNFTNATRAYLRSHPNTSYDSARAEAQKYLAKPHVRAILAEAAKRLIDSTVPNLEPAILYLWHARAFYNPADIIDRNGNLTADMETLKEKGLDVCIDDIERKALKSGDTIVRVKLADRTEALDKLQRYIQMIKPSVQRVEVAGITAETEKKIADALGVGE
jgi:phage terminase small subunit